MLTVRSKGIHGDEIIFETPYVICAPTEEKPSPTGTRLEFGDAHGSAHAPVYFGKTWVMNSTGATVATYNLQGWDLAGESA